MKPSISLIILVCFSLSCQSPEGAYVCTPCDLPCDELSFSEPGICPHCEMKLVKRSELKATSNFIVNEVNIQNGSGEFLVEGGAQSENTISVHYHRPNNFTVASDIIVVLPGAGRNGDDYRNAWIEPAEKYSILVFSLEYSEEHYPEFWNYNLAGMIYDVNVEDQNFQINQNSDNWIYGDFDRIFMMVKQELHLTQGTYDMFGHSAGGQILHRLAIFHPDNRINRMLASNSGWYTIATSDETFPYGLNEMDAVESETDYTSNLTIFLGEKDDASETRGHLRHTPEADKQGLHRLSRGQYFYETSKAIALKQGKEFNWKLEVIPDIGLDYRGMSHTAADYLYGERND